MGMVAAKGLTVTASGRSAWWLGLFLMAMLLPWAAMLFVPIYFRDYAIIWEGAYRMTLGQQPYQDFTMPVGPVSLWLPSWVMEIWGWQDAWLHFRYLECSLGSIVSTSFCLWLYQRRSTFPLWVAAIALFIFSGYYLWPNVLPWYNTTACFLALLGLFALPESGGKSSSLIFRWAVAGALLALSFLAKQDVGLVLSICLILYSWTRGKLPMLGLLLGMVVVLRFITWVYGPVLWQQLNLGSDGEGFRLSIGRFWRAWAQLDIRNTLVLLAVALLICSVTSVKGLWQRLVPRSSTAVVLVSSVVASYMSSALSGIPASHLYWAPFLWLGLWWLVNYSGTEATSMLHPLRWFVAALGVAWCIGAVQDLHASAKAPRITIEWGKGWITDNVLAREVPHVYSPILGKGFYPLAGPEDMIPDLERAKRDLNQWASTHKRDSLVMWNMSEWPAAYTWVHAEPAMGVPLWADVHTTVNKTMVLHLENYIQSRTAQVILWQPVHSSLPDSWTVSLEKNYIFLGQYKTASQTAEVQIWVVK